MTYARSFFFYISFVSFWHLSSDGRKRSRITRATATPIHRNHFTWTNQIPKSVLMYSLRKSDCNPVARIPQHNRVKYLGIYLDRLLTWCKHRDAKLNQIKVICALLFQFLNSKPTLSLEYKVLQWNTVIKPSWMYGVQLWGTKSATSIDKQRRQPKILKLFTGVPGYSQGKKNKCQSMFFFKCW